MRALLLVLALAVLLSGPCAAVDTEELKYALPEDAAGLLQEVDFTDTDPQRGFTALFQQAVQVLRKGLKASVTSAFFMTAVCMLVSLLQGFAKSAGVNLPARAGELSGATAILSLALGQNGALLELCRQAVSNLDRFTKVLCGVFAAASAAAGKPVSAAATAGAAMLFSDLLFQLTLKVFLPGVTLYLLLIYGSVICGNGTLRQAAGVEKWAVTAFFRVFLTVYFAYLTFTGLVSGSADAAAVKTAQTLSSTVPLVGSVIAGASDWQDFWGLRLSALCPLYRDFVICWCSGYCRCWQPGSAKEAVKPCWMDCGALTPCSLGCWPPVAQYSLSPLR